MLGAGPGLLLSPLRPPPLETPFGKVSDCAMSRPSRLHMTGEASGQSPSISPSCLLVSRYSELRVPGEEFQPLLSLGVHEGALSNEEADPERLSF